MFEYSRDGRSRIGKADADDPAGPWCEQPDPLVARSDLWDSWHLSTGPLLVDEPGGPLMFYNGADREASWGIGWAQFDAVCGRELARSQAPLIAPPAAEGPDGRRMAFAASAVRHADRIAVYYTLNDRLLRRATLRRTQV